MKVGNTDFNAEAIRRKSFAEFCNAYDGLLKGATLEEAYVACGGVIDPEPEPKSDGDEIREA